MLDQMANMTCCHVHQVASLPIQAASLPNVFTTLYPAASLCLAFANTYLHVNVCFIVHIFKFFIYVFARRPTEGGPLEFDICTCFCTFECVLV